MRPWIIVNGPDNMSEDTAYLIGRIAPHTETMRITSINRHEGRPSVGEIVVMPFMSGFKQRDRRILVVPDEQGEHRSIAAFTRKPAPGAWICNLSSGGSTEFEKALPEEGGFAAMVARRSGLDTAQLDIGWHHGRIYLIETNSTGGGYIDNDLGHHDNCADHVARFLKRPAAEGRLPEAEVSS